MTFSHAHAVSSNHGLSRFGCAIFLLTVASSVACGAADGGSTGSTPFVDPAADAGHADANGHTADEDAAKPDASPGSPQFVSNTPGAVVRDVSVPSAPDIALRSSNLLQEPSGDETYQRWFGEIENVGTETLCQVYVDVRFEDASGSELAKFSTYADAEPYDADSTLTMPCIAPGKMGTFFINNFVPVPAAIADTKTIAVGFFPHLYDNVVPAAHAPKVASAPVPVFGTMHGIGGSIDGVAAPISNIAVDFYPRDASGLVLARLSAVDLDTLMPGATFPFTTSGVETPFTAYRYYADFIDGPATQNRVLPGQGFAKGEAARLEVLRRHARAEMRARAAIAATRKAR